jgi:hypothetical protein
MPLPRQLVTIGDLRAARPLTRDRLRRQARTLGSATASTGSEALQDAALAFINALDVGGVPLESTVDPNVRAFQQAWNADPANAGDQLAVDGKYGPLTQGALNVMTGVAPPVNYGGAPPAPAPSPTPPGVLVTPAGGGGESTAFWLALAAVAVGGYLIFFRKRKKGATHHHHGTTLEVKSNPRRRLPRRRNAELIP